MASRNQNSDPSIGNWGVNWSGNRVWLWNGCARSQARQLWVQWSCPLWRDFGPSSEWVWSWECEWSDRGVCLTVMCPLYLILLSLKMHFLYLPNLWNECKRFHLPQSLQANKCRTDRVGQLHTHSTWSPIWLNIVWCKLFCPAKI